MKYTVYKTTNSINGHYYIGVHKEGKKPYLGSGDRITMAIKKYGKDNFVKEVLYTFETKEEAYLKEAELVTEDLINDPMSYNVKLGGDGGWDLHNNTNTVIVKDRLGNRFKVSKDDLRYISGELIPYNKGIAHSKESNLKKSVALKNLNREPRYCEICDKHIGGWEANWIKHLNSNGHLSNLTTKKYSA